MNCVWCKSVVPKKDEDIKLCLDCQAHIGEYEVSKMRESLKIENVALSWLKLTWSLILLILTLALFVIFFGAWSTFVILGWLIEKGKKHVTSVKR